MSTKPNTKKRKSGIKKTEPKKKTSVRFSSPQLSPSEAPSGARSSRSKTLKSDTNDYQDNQTETSSRDPSPEPRTSNKYNRTQSVGHIADSPNNQDETMTEFNLDPKSIMTSTRAKSAKSVHTIDYKPTDYKKRYEAVNTKNHELNRKINDYEWEINNLQNELKKYNKGKEHDDHGNIKYERTIKNKEKEIANLRRRLKLAINDYEKVYGYYKKQLELFKKNQQKWLREQKANGRDVTKYVFADDIKKVRIRKKGLRIYFVDGDDVVFEAIEVIGGSDYNDDDQYRNLVKRVREEEKAEDKKDIIDILEDDDMIILCLNELNARIRDFKHRNEEEYGVKIQERYDTLPLYHIEDAFLKQLKTNNSNWMKLFRKNTIKNGKRKGQLGGFFRAQNEMKSGAQPTICVQNNVILNNINEHTKSSDITYSQHLQEKIDRVHSKAKKKMMVKESSNNEDDEDLASLPNLSIGNGWFTAQIEMTKYSQQPSVCIKNNISLKHLQKKKGKFKVKKKLKAKMLQKRLDEKIKIKKNKNNKRKMIPMDKGDSSEEDENGNDIYNMKKNNKHHKDKTPKLAGFSNIMSGWFSAQIDITKSKQPTICVQNNVFLNNIDTTKEQIENDKKSKKSKKKKKKKGALTAASLQKKLNDTTSNGLSKIALDLSDDEDGLDDIRTGYDDVKLNDVSHGNMWYYNDTERRDWIKQITVSKERKELLLEIATYLNRLLPRSDDYDLIKHYLPIFNNVHDIMAALFDGVIISVLLNFLDSDLIDLRAINLVENKYPISRENVIENIFVIKASITAIDLHEFPDFDIDFDPSRDDEDVLSWYNPTKFVDILLLIIMHQFSGLLNKRINVLKYPELFRLCQSRLEKKTAQKTAAKEWLNRWIVFIRNPKMSKKGQFLSIDLGSYHSPVTSGNISWESIKILPQREDEEDDDEQKEPNYTEELIYVWNTDRRDFYKDILSVHSSLNVNIDNIDTIALTQDVLNDNNNNNYLMQFIYLSDLFVFNNKISKLSKSEEKTVHDYLHRKPSIDYQIIAWINSFKILDDDGNYQYVDNLSDDISNGTIILHLLDAVKPGCVDWKNGGVRTGDNIRHKFDKLTNCNILKRICDESFRDIFHLVGFGGNDIVDENPKYIRSLLLQIQRHHSTKLMAKILFKKKAVSDDDLLKWMNNRLKVYQKMVSAMKKMHHNDQTLNTVKMKQNVYIKSFEDRDSLADCISFCNVISSINPKWINYQFVYDDKQISSNQQISNARYLVTTLRRLGTDTVFTTPKELVKCQSTATISISTAIMTIAARYHDYDQLALFAKNLMQIKTKMQKK